MNISTFFLKRPMATLVLNLLLMIIGVLCFKMLPLREYPEVNFPRINVFTSYPNAGPDLVETAITGPLEDQLAGVEGLDRMQSYSRYGSSLVQLNFKSGISMDRALLAIREAVDLASLPKEAYKPLIQRETDPEGLPFMGIALESSTMDFAELNHYANLYLKNAFRSVAGVSSVQIWGQSYIYEVTLDPAKMFTFGLNADQVFHALQQSNVSAPVGKFQNKVPVNLILELKTQFEYETLVLKEQVSAEGRHTVVTLNDIADIALKTSSESWRVRVNGHPGIAISIGVSSEANPLEVSKAVTAQVNALQKRLPQGLSMEIIINQSNFIKASLHNIQSSIIEAVLLVLMIVFLFLRNGRASLIPLMTIPISLLGSFIFLKLFGFSLNTLTLMAMVLAVGLVVDDAIVVLENIQRHVEMGVPKKEAALQGAREISFAIVAMTLTLTSVYAPLAFISGPVGQLFVEFAVALAGSVLVSGVVALTLSPWMCSHLLSSHPVHWGSGVDIFLKKLTQGYQSSLTRALGYKKIHFAIVLVAFGCIALFIHLLPKETAPAEDRGLIGIYMAPIPGQTLDDMEKNMQTVEAMIQALPEAQTYLTFMGEWGGNVLSPLVSHTERSRAAKKISEELQPQLYHFPSVDVFAFSINSALPGVEQSQEQEQVTLVVSTTDSYQELFNQIEKLRVKIDQEKLFQNVSHRLNLNTAGYRIDLNMREMAALDLSPEQIARTIEIFFSGNQSLSFSKDNILYPLKIQGIDYPWSLNELYVTNTKGKRISIGAVATMTAIAQPQSLYHADQMRSVKLSADLKEGDSLENAMSNLMRLASDTLPSDYKKTWSGIAKHYQDSQATTLLLFALSILFILAILAVQFENIMDPFIILITVPLAGSGALLLNWLCGQSFNIYTQVGLITLIGIITKHGILIVEFANQLREKNMPLVQAITTAASLRLRPILMTTGAMILGAVPLVISHDAGHEARFAIGIVLIGGLSVGTLFTLFVLPAIYKIAHERS